MTKPGVLITGASSGIGRTTALHLAACGYQVFAGVRRESDAEALRREVRQGLTPILLDVTDQAQLQALPSVLAAELADGKLYGLINNAGISLTSPLEYVSAEHVERQFRTNVFGALATIQALLPLLRVAQGRIINISSGAGLIAVPMVGAYCASKFALEALSDTLRVELRRSGIRVSVIEPGVVTSSIHQKNFDDLDALLQRLPDAGLREYGDAIQRFRAANERMLRRATAAEDVARLIQRVLEHPRPRARYQAGSDARLLGWLRRWLSDGMKDRLLGKPLGL